MSDAFGDRQEDVGVAARAAKVFHQALNSLSSEKGELALISAQRTQEETLNILEERQSSPWFSLMDSIIPGLEARTAKDLLMVAEFGAKQELLATKDPLTGIENRRGLVEGLGKLIAGVKREQSDEGVAILLLDAIDFGAYNNKAGYDKGDELIRFWVEGYKEKIRREDVFARYGGDELVLVLGGESEETAKKFLFEERSSTDSQGDTETEPGVVHQVNASIEAKVVRDFYSKNITIPEIVPGTFRTSLLYISSSEIHKASSVAAQVASAMTRISQGFAVIKGIQDEQF